MTNQLVNPSFEDGTITGWTFPGGTPTVVSDAGAPDGAKVVEVVSDSAGAMTVITDTVPASAGETWSAGVYEAQVSGATRNVRVDIQWLNGGSVLSSNNGSSAALSGSYGRFVNEGRTAPALTDGVRIRIQTLSTAAGETFRIDAAQLEQGATLPAYNPATPSGASAGSASGLFSFSGSAAGAVSTTYLGHGAPVVVGQMEAALAQASGLAASRVHGDALYVNTDAGQGGLSEVRVISASDASTLAVLNFPAETFVDAEDLAFNDLTGTVFLADTGNTGGGNPLNLFEFDEPVSLVDQDVTATTYPVSYDDGATGRINEGMMIRPSDGQTFFAARGGGRLWTGPNPLVADTDNVFASGGYPFRAGTAAVDYSPDGSLIVCANAPDDLIEVYDADTLTLLDSWSAASPRANVEAACFSADGGTIFWANDSQNNTVGATLQKADLVLDTGTGSASGSFAFTGAASGSTARAGSTSGSFSFAGDASGKHVPAGSTSGSFSFAGGASGSGAQTGSASGSFSFAGSASGKHVPAGLCSGLFAFDGSATGKALRRGSASGSFTFTGDVRAGVPARDLTILHVGPPAPTYTATSPQRATYLARISASSWAAREGWKTWLTGAPKK